MILDSHERTYSAPPDEIGSTTEDIDYDDSEPYYEDVFQNNPSDTETL